VKKITQNSKLTFVELAPTYFGVFNGTPAHGVYEKYKLPSRAIPQLRAVLVQDGWNNTHEINPYYHGDKGRLTYRNMREVFASDALLISYLTRIELQSLKLADLHRLQNPNGWRIAGGCGPTYGIEEALKHVDIVVVKEGEETLRELMHVLKTDPSQIKYVKGVAYNRNGTPEITEPRPRLTEEELSQFPAPIYDEIVKKGITVSVLETSRGCPKNCNFCSVTNFNGRKYREKSPEWSAKEFSRIDNWGKHTFIIDDNLVGKGEESIGKLEAMAETNPKKRTRIAQVSVDAARGDKIIPAMKRAGINAVCVGIESIHDKSLKSLGKPTNADWNKEAVRRFREAGLYVFGMMIVGGDGETKESLKETSVWINDNLDAAQIFPPHPLPGTRFAQDMMAQGRILSTDPYSIDCQSVMVRPENFTPLENKLIIDEMYKSFYSPKRLAKRLRSTSSKLSAIVQSIWASTGGLDRLLNNPQSRAHEEFLRSVS